jgi:hypothetical protein
MRSKKEVIHMTTPPDPPDTEPEDPVGGPGIDTHPEDPVGGDDDDE